MLNDIHPFALRDAINPLCTTCGLPKKQTEIVTSRRGNFQHGATKVKIKTVGEICKCAQTAQADGRREDIEMAKRQVIKQQLWFCENCNERGTVGYRQHAAVYEVLNLIEDDHSLKSPHCSTPVAGLRIVN